MPKRVCGPKNFRAKILKWENSGRDAVTVGQLPLELDTLCVHRVLDDTTLHMLECGTLDYNLMASAKYTW